MLICEKCVRAASDGNICSLKARVRYDKMVTAHSVGNKMKGECAKSYICL